MRRHGLENLAVSGKVDGRRGRGRQRLKYLDSLCTCLRDKVSSIQLIRASDDRRLWHHMVANVVEDDGTLKMKEGILSYTGRAQRTSVCSVRWIIACISEHQSLRVTRITGQHHASYAAAAAAEPARCRRHRLSVHK